MCTSFVLKTEKTYYGRNLDLEYAFGEQVVITPRNYVFRYRKQEARRAQFAMIGMANVTDNYPLYAEAVNEKGLYAANLNFPGNAFYPKEEAADKDNITPFELIPWLLGSCESVAKARELCERLNLIGIPFSEKMPLAPLHWHIADREQSIVLEPMQDGLKIYDNPIGVLTNNPPFPFHLTNLRQYLNLTAKDPENRFGGETKLSPFGQGMGAFGLPGDYSPSSRFVKAAFLKENSNYKTDEPGSVTQVFHILDALAMVSGAVMTPEGKCDKTTYSCCLSADEGIYYYKTYENSRITAVRLAGADLDGGELSVFPLAAEQQIAYAN